MSMQPRTKRNTSKAKRAPARRPASSVPPMRDDLAQEIAGVLLAAVGVWLYLSLADLGGGQVGGWLASGLTWLVGRMSWVFPGALIWLGGYLVYLRRGFTLTWRVWGVVILLLSLTASAHSFYDPSVMFSSPAVLRGGGGILGAGLAYPLAQGLGSAGRWVALSAFLVVGLILVTQASLGLLLQSGGRRVAQGGQGARSLATDFWSLVSRRPPAPPAAKPLPTAYQAEISGRRFGGGASGEAPSPVPPAAMPPADRLPWEGPKAQGAKVVDFPASGSASASAGVENALPPAGSKPEADRQPPLIHLASDPGAGSAAQAHLPGLAPAPAAKAPSEGKVKGSASQPASPAPRTAERAPQVEVAEVAPAAIHQSGPAEYRLPPLTLLGEANRGNVGTTHKEILERSELLEKTLRTFGVEAKVLEVHIGPAITRFELQPAPGVKVSKIVNLADDLALNLAAEDVRIEAPIPGKAAIGIEVPNKERAAVYLRDVLESPDFVNNPSKLTIALGKDIAGRPVIGALEKMPHLLIAGSTGSGKSVCMNTIITSILFKCRPDEVKMLMIDPKMVELSTYNGIPHLAAPVCTDPRKAAGYLKWAVREMENRYELFAATGVRDITRYNQLCQEDPGPDRENPRKPLPYIIILIDELADLMMVAPGEVEDAICRLAQMARACGMHLVVATQRPSVDVITGLIKANVPSRIAFAVSSQIDSRTILDMGGAEKLLGRGDMLFFPVGKSKPERAQGAFIDEKEVEAVVKFTEMQGRPEYQAEALEVEGGNGRKASGGEDKEPSSHDAQFAQAVRIIIEEGRASVSILQRRLRVNYTKAARLIDDMFERGWVGPHQGPKPREVLITMPMWHEIFGGGDDEVAAGEDL